MRVFGSLCFAITLSANKKKLDSRSRKCIHIRFKDGVKGYILFDLHSKEIFLSRDVIFFEHIFPYQSSVSNDSVTPHLHMHRFLLLFWMIFFILIKIIHQILPIIMHMLPLIHNLHLHLIP